MFPISANYNVGKYFLFKNLFTAEACYDQSVPQAFCNCQSLGIMAEYELMPY